MENQIKEEARKIGFHLVGIACESPKADLEFYNWWVDQGFGGEMHFLKSQKAKRENLEKILPSCKSVIMCAVRFPGENEFAQENTAAIKKPQVPAGKIARYALHEDYHNTIKPKLDQLAEFIQELAKNHGHETKSLTYVDTGALSERSLAMAAGIGWVGKNSMLINQEEGSFFWLGEILTTLPLKADSPVADHCGKCRRCIDACPTSAIFENLRAIDSKRCLAYLNIEHRGPIPNEFHSAMGDWLLGCDICQEICPWNEHSLKRARKDVGAAPVEWIPLSEIESLTKEEFLKKYKSRAVSRAKFEGLRRNAKIVRGNFERQRKKAAQKS